jgi:hypothetical protein
VLVGFYVYFLIPLFISIDVSCCVLIISLAGRTGVKTAYMWYSAGARTLGDVLAGKGSIKLTPQQEIGIRYYDGKSTYLR